MKNITDKIFHLGIAKRLIRWSQGIILPGFKGLPLYDVIEFFYMQINTVGINERAAAISFNFMLAIPSTLLFLFSLVPYIPASQEFTVELLNIAQTFSPDLNTYLLIKDFIIDFTLVERKGVLSIGFLLVVFYSSNTMMGIMNSFDKSLGNPHTRNYFEKRWIAVKLTTFQLFSLIACILLLITQGVVFTFILDSLNMNSNDFRILVQIIRWVIIVSLLIFSISLTYRYAPSIKENWGYFSPGTILTTILIVATTLVFSFWVDNFNSYNKIYGSIGTLMILMVLVFLNSLVMLIGFELNVSISYLKFKADQRTELTTSGII